MTQSLVVKLCCQIKVGIYLALSCYKCTIKSGKEEECKPDQVLMVSVHADRNHTNWCVTSVEKSTKGRIDIICGQIMSKLF